MILSNRKTLIVPNWRIGSLSRAVLEALRWRMSNSGRGAVPRNCSAGAVRDTDDDASQADLWARFFGDAERPALAGGADSGSAQRFALFAEVRRRLAQAAGTSGLLLVLDDLQWADDASAALLADVVRQLRGTPILIFATYRDSAASEDGPSAGLLRGLAADASTERVDLRGLAVSAVGDLLLAAGLPASPGQTDEVHSETGGNPFLVRELASMLVEQGRGDPASPGPANPGPANPGPANQGQRTQDQRTQGQRTQDRRTPDRADRGRCRDGCSRRPPTGSPSCQIQPGRCCGPRR